MLPRNVRLKLLEAVEGVLCASGALSPRLVRSGGGTPSVWKDVAVNVKVLYEAFLAELLLAIHEDAKGSVGWSSPSLNAALDKLGLGLQRILADAVDQGVAAGLEAAAKQLDDPSIVFTSVDTGILETLKGQAITLSEATAAKIRGDVKRELYESVRLGETTQQAMDRLKSISSLSDYEAERIVRTEMAKAANTARLQGYKGRLSHVVWVLGPAYKGGCGCPDLVGTYTLEEAMSLSMPLHPNCDCYWRPASDEEALAA